MMGKGAEGSYVMRGAGCNKGEEKVVRVMRIYEIVGA